MFRQLNSNGTVAARPSLDNSIAPRRQPSIASTSSSTTASAGVNIPIQPVGRYHARRATIEVDTDSDTEELTSRRRRHTPQQQSTSSSEYAANKQRPPRQGRRSRNSGTSPHYPTTTNMSTNFPVYQRHQKSQDKDHGDTLV